MTHATTAGQRSRSAMNVSDQRTTEDADQGSRDHVQPAEGHEGADESPNQAAHGTQRHQERASVAKTRESRGGKRAGHRNDHDLPVARHRERRANLDGQQTDGQAYSQAQSHQGSHGETYAGNPNASRDCAPRLCRR